MKVKVISTPQNINKLKKFINGGEPSVNKSMSSVPREIANVEAEGNEQVVVPGQGIPENYTIKGPRHSQGGVPMLLEQDSFIFSDNKKKMKIKDPMILEEFGMKKKKGGYTPAEIAKKYDLNKYIKILNDESADDIEKETAEQMIDNYKQKLAKLALVQESMKGFKDGIPAIAMPYLMSVGISPEQLMPQVTQPEIQDNNPPMPSQEPMMSMRGSMRKYQGGGGIKKRVRIKPKLVKVNGLDYIKTPDGQLVPVGHETLPGDGESIIASTADDSTENSTVEDDTNIETSNIKTIKSIPSKYKTDKYKVGSDKFNIYDLKEGDYIQDKDGKWKRIKTVPAKIEYTNPDLESIFSNNQDIANTYEYINRDLSNPQLQELLYNELQKTLKNSKYFKRKNNAESIKFDPSIIENMTPQEIVSQLNRMQKRNIALQAHGIDPRDFTDGGKSLKPNLSKEKKERYKQLGISSLTDAFNKVGMPLTDEDNVALQQASYFAFNDLVKNADNIENPEVKSILEKYKVPAVGEGDESQTGYSAISPIDDIYGNTTAGEILYRDTKPVLDTEEIQIEKAKENFKPEDAQYEGNIPAEWWAQDLGTIAMNARDKFKLKKYLPHMQGVELQTPDVLYYDPTRALAANAEQSNIAAQAVRNYAGPQSTYQLSGIQSQGSDNAANIVGEYADRNVQIGNNYLANVANTHNQQSQINAEKLQRFFDQSTIANQQYDNAQRLADRNIFDAWRQGLTNKMMTQGLNSIYDNFYTDPSIGGGIFLKHGRGYEDTGSYPESEEETTLKKVQRLSELYPDLDQEIIFKTVTGNSLGSTRNNKREMMSNFLNQFGFLNK